MPFHDENTYIKVTGSCGPARLWPVLIVYLSFFTNIFSYAGDKCFILFIFVEVRRTTSVMSTKKYDFIIFGATGFTGQYVAEEVSRIAEKEGITWAVAGRNSSKLRSVLDSVQKFTGMSYLPIAHSTCLYTSNSFLYFRKIDKRCRSNRGRSFKCLITRSHGKNGESCSQLCRTLSVNIF